MGLATAVAAADRSGHRPAVTSSELRFFLVRARRALTITASQLALGGALAACGHPATPEECSEILDKSAAVELASQGVTDPAVVAERTTAFRAAHGEALLSKCKGRPMTTRALECIRQAKTAVDIDRCLY